MMFSCFTKNFKFSYTFLFLTFQIILLLIVRKPYTFFIFVDKGVGPYAIVLCIYTYIMFSFFLVEEGGAR